MAYKLRISLNLKAERNQQTNPKLIFEGCRGLAYGRLLPFCVDLSSAHMQLEEPLWFFVITVYFSC